ncbi:MAG: Cna B-type domain-containing protein, partial [Clostridia bacterium]|nr:Cna B-type domain-containing protein [Clostridia bacterium]
PAPEAPAEQPADAQPASEAPAEQQPEEAEIAEPQAEEILSSLARLKWDAALYTTRDGAEEAALLRAGAIVNVRAEEGARWQASAWLKDQAVEAWIEASAVEQLTASEAERSVAGLTMRAVNGVDLPDMTSFIVEAEAPVEAARLDFSYRDSRVEITAVADEAANLPQSAELHADYIAPGTEAYAQALARLTDAYDLAEDETLDFVYYDIYFIADGARIEPEDGKVRVSVAFLQPAGDELETKEEVVDTGVAHFTGSGELELLDGDVALDGEGRIEAANFTTDSFSGFGFSRTIRRAQKVTGNQDITNRLTGANLYVNGQAVADETWTLEKGTTYSLELSFAETTGDQFPDDASEMRFKVPSVLKAMYDDETREGTFTISLNNGAKETQANFEFVNEGGQDYIVFTFDEEDPNFGDLAEAGNARFSFDMSFTYEGDGGELKFNENVVKDVIVNDEHSITGEKQGNASTVKKGQSFAPLYNENAEADSVQYTVVIESTGTNPAGSTVQDTLQTSGLKLNADSIYVVETVRNAKGASQVLPAVKLADYLASHGAAPATVDEGGFSFTLPEMKDGGKLSITYLAAIDYDALEADDNLTAAKEYGSKVKTAENKLVFDPTPIDGGELQESSATIKIPLTSIGKASGGRASDGDKVELSSTKLEDDMSWTITVNPDKRISMAGKSVSDALVSPELSYSGAGITITAEDADGNVPYGYPKDVAWDALSGYTQNGGWSYAFPDTDEKYAYTITYTTKVEKGNHKEDFRVSNTATGDVCETTGSGEVGISNLYVSKTHSSASKDRIKWKITVTVPKGVAFESLVVTDTMPRTGGGWSGYYYHDTASSVSVNGPDELANPTISYTEQQMVGWEQADVEASQADADRIVLDFGAVEAAEEDRVVTITIDSAVDQDWREAYPSDTHTNNVSVDGDGNVKTAADSVVPRDKSLTKSGYEDGTVHVVTSPGYWDSEANMWHDEEGVDLPVYTYQVLLTGVDSSPIRVVDTFDTEYLKIYEEGDKAPKIEGGSGEWSLSNISGATLTVESTASGAVFVAEVPETSTGYEPYYRISYSLIVKDAETLAKLNEETAKTRGATHTFSNLANWNGLTGEQSFDYTFNLVDKTCTNTNTINPNQLTARFKLTANPDKLLIGTAKTLELVDTHNEHLEVDYASIEYTTDPAGGEVTYNVSANTITFQVPNQTKVEITYNATIINPLQGGQRTHISNEASMYGQTKVFQADMNLTRNAQGSASTPFIVLFKQQQGRTDIPLNGVTFTLYKQEEDGSWTSRGDFTTGDFSKRSQTPRGRALQDGEALVYFTAQDEGGVLDAENGTLYKLVEQDPHLPGYVYDENDNTFYFKLDENETDWDSYQYAVGSYLRVNNKPVGLQITKTFAGLESLSQAEVQALMKDITFTVSGPGLEEPLELSFEDMVYDEKDSAQGTDTYTIKLTPPDYLLTAGETYTVTESNTAVEGYELLSTSYTVGEASGDSETAEFVLADDGVTLLSFENTYRATETEVEVTKLWTDGRGLAAGWPAGVDSVTIQLQRKANGEWQNVAGKTLELTSEKLKDKFTKLPKYDGEDEIEYRVVEDEVEGYNAKIAGGDGKFTVTNKPRQTALSISKAITGLDGYDGELDTSEIRFVIEDTAESTDFEPVTIYYDEMTVDGANRVWLLTEADGIVDGHSYKVTEYGAQSVADALQAETGIEYMVTATVNDEEGDDATLAVTSGEEAAFEFENSYSSKTARISVTKTVVDGEGKPLDTDNEYTFTITPDGETEAVATLTVGAGETATTDEELPLGSYVVAETGAPAIAGYEAADADDTFTSVKVTLSEDDIGETVEVAAENVYNKKTDVDVNSVELKLSKVDAANSSAIDAVVFTLTDAAGDTVATGSTDGDGLLTLTISADDLGSDVMEKAFTLTETPKAGYMTAGPWTVNVVASVSPERLVDDAFVTTWTWSIASVVEADSEDGLTADDDGVYTIENSRSGFKVSKRAASGVAELPGATIQLLDSENNVVQLNGEDVEWESGNEPHEIVGLTPGSYKLRETAAPDGYAITSDTAFTLNEDGTITAPRGSVTTDDDGITIIIIRNAQTEVRVSKTDIASGEELAGAHIQILDATGKVVTLNGEAVEWDSTGEAKVIEGLKAGETYTL